MRKQYLFFINGIQEEIKTLTVMANTTEEAEIEAKAKTNHGIVLISIDGEIVR